MAKQPKAVREAAERADRLIRGDGAQTEQTQEAGNQSEPVKQSETQESPKQEARQEPPKQERQQEATPGQAPPQQPQQQAAPAETDEETYRQRYATLQGKYNSEVPVLQRQVNALTAQLSTLTKQLERTPEPTPQNSSGTSQQASFTGKVEELANPQEIEDYGPEFIELVGKIAAKVVEDRVKSLTPSQARAPQGQPAEPPEANPLVEALDGAVPNWRSVNTSVLFHEWLQQVDQTTGETLHALLKEAHAAGKIPRVVNIFQRFWREKGEAFEGAQSGTPPAQTQQQQETSAPPQNSQPPQSRDPLEQFAGPPTSAGSNAPATQSDAQTERTYSRAEISQFYNDVAKGVYRNREDERQKKDAELIRAAKENRVV